MAGFTILFLLAATFHVSGAANYFLLENRNGHGKCLDVSGQQGTADGQNVQIYDCDYARPHGTSDQHWSMDSHGLLRSAASGKCLDVVGDKSTHRGQNVDIYRCDDDMWLTDQRWTLTPGDGVYFQLKNFHTGLCLDVDGDSEMNNGQNVDQYTCEAYSDPNSDQWWIKVADFE